MSTRTILLAAVAHGLIIGVDIIEAVDPPADVNCEDDGTSGSPLTASIVKAYLIYVSYPGNPDSIVAAAANSTIASLSNWVNFASNGKQQFNLTVLRRLDDPNKAWRMSTIPDPPLPTEVAPAPVLHCPNGTPCNPSNCPVEQCTWRCSRPWEYRTVGGVPGCYWPENYTGSGHHRMGYYELANRDVVRRIYNHYRVASREWSRVARAASANRIHVSWNEGGDDHAQAR